jgi:DNA-binding response OmpR family regulator
METSMKKKILVVDDEPDFLEMIKIRLEAANYAVTTAANGIEALDKIKQDKPDAVLLDILMPKFDGLQTLKEMRKEDKNLPIFIITATSDKDIFTLAKELGAFGFIWKTGDLKEEVKNITAVLSAADKRK